jgi:hypothetical protein
MKIREKDLKDWKDLKDYMTVLLVFLALLVFCPSAIAQHLRVFACAISNDSAGAFLGGSSRGSGLYQSDDTGKTWKHLGWDNIKCYSMDMVQSSNGRILYEATGLGVLRSTDYGEHWKQITDWRVSEVLDIAINQTKPSKIYLATAHGAWQTGDGGKTWWSLQNNNQRGYVNRVLFDEHNKPFWYLDAEDRRDNHVILIPDDVSNWKTRIIGTIGVIDSADIGRLHVGVDVDGVTTLTDRQIWTLKSYLVTP